MKNTFLNIAGYKFITMNADDMSDLRTEIKKVCEDLSCKGTILISEEGINIVLAGLVKSINDFTEWLTHFDGLQKIDFKVSYSGYQPFNRMLVKIKNEIIPFGEKEIQPSLFTAPYVDPVTLKRRLDRHEKIVLLDVRNRYETRLGTFAGAITLEMDVFRSFPAVSKKMDIGKSEPIVTFCTGGIRCEKASAYLLKEGFENVLQLQGGILNYFEHCGKTHYDGDCFVYDQRVCLDHNLEETDTVQCFNCSFPVTKDEQKLESYRPNVSCIHCINGKPKKLQVD